MKEYWASKLRMKKLFDEFQQSRPPLQKFCWSVLVLLSFVSIFGGLASLLAALFVSIFWLWLTLLCFLIFVWLLWVSPRMKDRDTEQFVAFAMENGESKVEAKVFIDEYDNHEWENIDA